MARTAGRLKSPGIVFAILAFIIGGGVVSVWLRERRDVQSPRPIPIVAAGRVISHVKGQGAAGLTVAAVPEGSSGTQGPAPAPATTDESGRFTIFGSYTGPASLLAYGLGNETWTCVPVRVDTLPEDGLEIEIVPGVPLTVAVVDDDRGAPASDADVQISGEAEPAGHLRVRFSTTGVDGLAHFQVRPGEAVLWVRSPPRGYVAVNGKGNERKVVVPDSGASAAVAPLRVRKAEK